jgi:hypothetical protein
VNGAAREVHLAVDTRASCEAVYETLVDADAHLDWAGRRQPPFFRLLSLTAGGDDLAIGATFASTGSIPGSRRQFHDESRVTVAERPSTFEFVTDATVAGRRPMQATFRHRYDIEPHGAGCHVRYSLRQESIVNPMLRLSLPVVRDITWKVGMPLMLRGGLRNLVRSAERRGDRTKL